MNGKRLYALTLNRTWCHRAVCRCSAWWACRCSWTWVRIRPTCTRTRSSDRWATSRSGRRPVGDVVRRPGPAPRWRTPRPTRVTSCSSSLGICVDYARDRRLRGRKKKNNSEKKPFRQWKRGRSWSSAVNSDGDVRPTVWRLTDWRLLNAAVAVRSPAAAFFLHPLRRGLPPPPHSTPPYYHRCARGGGRPLHLVRRGYTRSRRRWSAPVVGEDVVITPLVEICVLKNFIFLLSNNKNGECRMPEYIF